MGVSVSAEGREREQLLYEQRTWGGKGELKKPALTYPSVSFLNLSKITFAESALPTLTMPAFQSTTIGHLILLSYFPFAISSTSSPCPLLSEDERNKEDGVREPFE